MDRTRPPPALGDDPLAPVLSSAIVALGVLGVGIELAHTRTHSDPIEFLVELLSLSYEQNLPTWAATCLLFACGVSLARVAVRARATRAPFARRWWALAGAFFYLSLDEMAELHESLAGAGGGVLHFDWVIPGAVIVALLAAVYAPLVRALPPVTRRRFVVAAVLYVGGALVMELPLGWWVERAGEDNLGYALIDAVEELLELGGAAIFLLAVRAHAATLASEPS